VTTVHASPPAPSACAGGRLSSQPATYRVRVLSPKAASEPGSVRANALPPHVRYSLPHLMRAAYDV